MSTYIPIISVVISGLFSFAVAWFTSRITAKSEIKKLEIEFSNNIKLEHEKLEMTLNQMKHEKEVSSDIKLFTAICEEFTPEILEWIGKRDLGEPQPFGIFDGLSRLTDREKDNAFSVFHNEKIEKEKLRLYNSLNCFLDYRNDNTQPYMMGEHSVVATRLWMVNYTDWLPRKDDYFKVFQDEQNEINRLANQVWNSYNSFVITARNELGL